MVFKWVVSFYQVALSKHSLGCSNAASYSEREMLGIPNLLSRDAYLNKVEHIHRKCYAY